MLFTKTAPGVSLSTLARSKKFWGTSASGQGAANPGFFVSTPQFNLHQRTQVVVYAEDGRGAGSSGSTADSQGIDNPYLALTAGGNGASAAPGLYFDDDSKEDTHIRVFGPTSTTGISKTLSMDQHPYLNSKDRHHEAATNPESSVAQKSSLSPEDADELDRAAFVRDMMTKMHRLHASGSHSAVLATFEVMEDADASLPVDAYNIVLDTLASTSDVSTILEAYEKMLSRGIRPNDTTYSIVLSSLLDAAASLNAKKTGLLPYLGDGKGVLESVDEIYEGLGAEEYLVLSQTILQAVVATHPRPWDADLQACLDRVIEQSIKHDMELPVQLLDLASAELSSLISIEPSIGAAAGRFASLNPRTQQSEGAQVAMMQAYFKFSQPSGAIAFYSACGTPSHLLKPLLVGFASSGLVGTARRWVDATQANGEVVADVLKSIDRKTAKEFLPSATELFYAAIGRGGASGSSSNGSEGAAESANAGRCAFIRLCIAADNEEALLMAIKESHLSGAIWDAVTVSEVIDYLSRSQQPLLAADVCCWQVPQLQSAYESKELKSFVDQEIVSDSVALLQSRDQLSLDASLRLLPVSVTCSSARKSLVDTVATAKLHAPHELAELMSAERLGMIIGSLAAIMTSSSHRATSEELTTLRSIFPAFVEEAITRKVELSITDVLNVQETLRVCDNVDALTKIWRTRYVEKGATASSHRDPAVPSEVSITIQKYALAPNGIPIALSLLKEQLLLKRTISVESIDAVIFACAKNNMGRSLQELNEILPASQTTLNSLIVAACESNDLALAHRCYEKLVHELGVYPMSRTYLSMFNAQTLDLQDALALFSEARNDAQLDVGPDLYNAFIRTLAHHSEQTELQKILMEMRDRNFQLSVISYESLIAMYVALGDGAQALQILQEMPRPKKDLLSTKTFNDLMSFFVLKAGDRNSSLEVFGELRKSNALADPQTYRLLIEAYLLRTNSDGPNLENADQVLRLMRHDGVPITTQCYAALLRARGVLFRDFEGARNFYRGMVKNSRVLPDRNVFQSLLESYVFNGKQSEIHFVQDEMKRYHVALDDNLMKNIA